jgi:hypothetical protein
MTNDAIDDGPVHEGSVARCLKLARLLVAGRITFEEYADNATLAIASGPSADIARCVESIPPGFADAFLAHLQDTLEPVDFMPCPRPFLAGNASDEAIERTRRELRPRYLQLYQMMSRTPAAIDRSEGPGISPQEPRIPLGPGIRPPSEPTEARR